MPVPPLDQRLLPPLQRSCAAVSGTYRVDGNHALVFPCNLAPSRSRAFFVPATFPRCIRPSTLRVPQDAQAVIDRTFLGGAWHYAGAVGDEDRIAYGAVVEQHSVAGHRWRWPWSGPREPLVSA